MASATSRSDSKPRFNPLTAAAALFVVAAGLWLLQLSRAATVSVIFDPSSSNTQLTGAAICDDAQASGNSFLKFQSTCTITNTAAPLWHADADTDAENSDRTKTKYWGKEVASGDWSRLSIVDDPLGKYGKVYQAYLTPAEIAAGHKRAEWAQAYLPDGSKLRLAQDSTAVGQTRDLWIGWRSLVKSTIYAESSHDNDGNFMQMKGDSSCGGPAIGMTIKFGRLTMRSEQYLPQYNDIAWNGPSVKTFAGSWHDFLMHVNFSKDPIAGFLELWLDSQPQTMMNGRTRLNFQTVCQNDTYIYPKIGTYGMDYTDGTNGPYHWVESMRIGHTRAAVEPR